MSDVTNHILEFALNLPPEDRAKVAACLLASMDGGFDDGVDAAWEAEVQRRLQSDESNDIAWEDLNAELAKKYGGK